MKLEHLSPYLPFKIWFIYDGKKLLCKGIYNIKGCWYFKATGGVYLIDECKPILRPLSDLTKQRIDIIYFGVIATDNDMYGTRDEFEDDLEIWLCDMAHIPLCVYNFLIMNHFDVFGLIEKGLAIDINTL